MSEQREIKDVHPVVQAAIDAIDKDPNDHIWWNKPAVSQGMGTSGHSDFHILYHGVFIAIECKYDMWLKHPTKISTSKTRLPTTLQCKQLRKTELAGGLALVVDRHTMHLVAELLVVIKKQHENLDEILYGVFYREHERLHWKQFARDTPQVEL